MFEENKVEIKNVIINQEIKLLFKKKEIEFELTLIYNKTDIINNNSIINDIEKIKREINNLKEEIIKISKEIYTFKKAPKNKIKLKLLSDLIDDSFAYTTITNTFTVFKSINNILYLIYSTQGKSIICYDLNDQKKIIKLKDAHNKYITNLRHYLEEINKRDLIMSISIENNIKIWNANIWECILNLNNINTEGRLHSACFINKDNKTYFITSNSNRNGFINPIKIFDLKGHKINSIQNSNDNTLFIDTYYDGKLSKYYLITANSGFVKSYDYEQRKIYFKYNDPNNNNCSYFNIIINNKNGIIELISSCSDGIIRIFNFHSSSLINKIIVNNLRLIGLCLWDDNYLFVGSKDKSLKILDIKKGIVVKNLSDHFDEVLTIKKIIHPKYGNCLLSQNFNKSHILLWKIDI